MRLNYGLTAEPSEATLEEPEDLEEFFHSLTHKFRMSTTQNLSLLHNFEVRPRESVESLFARFNDAVRALEIEEYPMVTT